MNRPGTPPAAMAARQQTPAKASMRTLRITTPEEEHTRRPSGPVPPDCTVGPVPCIESCLPPAAFARRQASRHGASEAAMREEVEPGRPAVEAVFVAWVVTTVAGLAAAHALARLLPPQLPPGTPLPAVSLTLCILYVSLAFAFAQATLPGPRSTGCLGLLVPLTGAMALAVRGLAPSAV